MPSDQAAKNIGGAVPLRFVQIVAAPEGAGDGFESSLFGLTADGQVYAYRGGRERLAEPIERKGPAGLPYKDHYGPWYYWWQPVRMSTEKGAEFEPPATPKEFF